MEPLIKLKDQVGLRAYAALRRGAYLHLWRRSSPYNWWIENRHKDMLWHSNGWGDRPSLDLFDRYFTSNNLIKKSMVHSSGGNSDYEKYILKPEYQIKPKIK